MHRSDILIIGPLGPLVPRPVRLRLGLVLASVATGLCLLVLAVLVLAWQAEWLPIELQAAVGQAMHLPHPTGNLPRAGPSR
jgi:hypothetical protein